VALQLLDEALALARRLKDRLAETGAWDRRGSILRHLHRYREAEDSYNRSLEISRKLGSPVNQGSTLANLGWLDLDVGNVARARDRLRVAVNLLESSGDPNGETFARIGLSRAERRLGAYGPAREQIDAALRLIEEMRSGLSGPMSRGSFLATRYDGYEDLVSLLMELHRREPENGHDREALEVVERARARNLSEVMAGEPAAPREDGEEAVRRRIVRAEIRSIEERRQKLALESPRDPRIQGLDADLRARSLELDRLAAVDTRQPGIEPLTAAQIQALAGKDTVLVVYLLSEPASFVWAVDQDGIESCLLPDRGRIEVLARRVVAAMSQGPGLATQSTAARATRELSEAVLGPLRKRLDGRERIAVLADGALLLVPFAALPEPGTGKDRGEAQPLLARHEIVVLPSATFLDRQRHRLAGRRPASGALAVIADPVFSPDDIRLSRRRGDVGSPAPRGFEPAGPFQRLPYTEREARSILRLAQGGETLLAMGTEARRDLVTSGTLGHFRILHFATHGLLHPVLPERSGLVLSLYDREGRRQDGFLSAPDVATLSLPAELAVLSACQTGLGRELRGEGLVGLAQAFFRAGTRRVIVSQWSVQDRATAELMTRVYRGLLVDHLPPAAALRAAQLAIRSQPQWQSPYYWAGFSLQGDWR
jgi:CHAT domain-containing protein